MLRRVGADLADDGRKRTALGGLVTVHGREIPPQNTLHATLPEAGEETRAHLTRRRPERFVHERLFRREVGVEAAHREPGSVHHVGHLGAADAPLPEEP